MTFGEKLKYARTEAGIKQSDLAKQLKTTGNTISNWENDVSKPDLDKLAYLCGILHTTPSFFLEAVLPEDEVSIPELKMIKKYRDLDSHGREMVDFTLEKEWERSTKKDKIVQMPVADYLKADAAHTRTDIDISKESDTSENDIMESDDF